MIDIFLKVVNMSIAASWLVLAVFLLRFLLKKAPKWLYVLMWGIVGIRLALPFSIKSMFSLIPTTKTIPDDIMLDPSPAIDTGFSSFNNIINPVITQAYAPDPATSANPLQIEFAIWANIWSLGMLALLLYTAISYMRLRRSVATAVRLRGNIYQSESVTSPFVLGLFQPRIYLPFSIQSTDMPHVIAHEQAHIDRHDHWWKPLGFLLLTLHWFNPLMWVAYILLCRDIELACDEKVIKHFAPAQRADYSQALLCCSVSRRMITACPLAFGEVGVKSRVKSVLNYKKPGFWVIVLAVVLCGVAVVCFLTDPVDSIQNPAVQEYIPGGENMVGNVDKDSFESIHPHFAIGADKYGRAVFKEPYRAFDTMLLLYADGIELIQKNNALSPISYTNFSAYKKMGWQTTGDSVAQEQAAFITKFLDIYENSFDQYTPTNAPAPTTEPTSAESLLTWAQTLSVADVMQIELVVMPQALDKQYRLFSDDELEKIVAFINSCEGTPSTNTEPLAGSSITFYITTRDGVCHTVGNNANGFLVIDGVYFSATYEWLSGWVSLYGEGNAALPDQFYEKRFGQQAQSFPVKEWFDNYGKPDQLDAPLEISLDEIPDITFRWTSGTVVAVDKQDEVHPLYSGSPVWSVFFAELTGDTTPELCSTVSEQNDPDNTYLIIYDYCDQVSYTMKARDRYNYSLFAENARLCYRKTVYGSDELVDMGYLAYSDSTVKLVSTDPSIDKIERAINRVVLEHNAPSKGLYSKQNPDGVLHVESHVILGTKSPRTTEPLLNDFFTVYLLVLQEQYAVEDGVLGQAVSGNYVPVALTFAIDFGLNGKYALQEYWEPRDGTYYDDDIRDKFPHQLAEDALDAQAYIDDLKTANRIKAETLLKEITE